MRISTSAQVLTDEHGLDGFTMDDLAVAAGVSRRTLFNYYPGKVDAVLGPWPGLDDDRVAVFVAGGPTRDLVEDLRRLILPLLEFRDIDQESVRRARRILLANPRLVTAAHDRYQTLSGQVIAHVTAREGPGFTHGRARVAVALLAAILDASLDEFVVDDRQRPISHHFDEALAAARSLLGC